MSQDLQKSFFKPYGRYYGRFTPGQLAFNANLQDFANEIGAICELETSGKLSAEDAYRKILTLWEVLQESRDSLLEDESVN